MLSTPLSLGLALLACGDYMPMDLPSRLAWNAVSSDAAVAESAIAELRSMGPDGLQALVAVHAAGLDAYGASFDAASPAARPYHLRLASAVDAVGGQRDNFAGRLYWHTDLGTAKQFARDSGKPILSLHLLGRLDEEYSCANSRFFRAAVYSHAGVAQSLRDDFVLHWETVRPIPEITIDFGDGRTLHRTITGNSCHFVLDAEGRPIDAIPGLYGPQAFLDEIGAARAIHRAVSTADDAARMTYLRAWHASQLASTRAQWAMDRAAAGAASLPSPGTLEAPGALGPPGAPGALLAAPIAVTKAAVEIPMVTRLLPAPPSFDVLAGATDAETWKLIAGLHHARVRLDDGGRRVLRKKHGTETLDRVAANFEASMALDTVRNEYLLHTRIHEWFAGAAVGDDPRVLSDRIYADLFLTPRSDPWMGLLPANTFAALDGGGITR